MTDPDGADRFAYDALDRLKKVTREVGGVDGAVEDYDYNALGALKLNAGIALDHQRPRLDGAGNADAAVPATVGGQAVTLDAGGRVTSLRGTTFDWEALGLLRHVQEPIPALAEVYGVDSNLRRISKSQGADTELYVYEGLDRIATIFAPGTQVEGPLKEGYLFDGIDQPLRIARPGASTNYYYYEIDLAGNVRGLRASGGASLGGYRYSAFGKTLEDTSLINQPLRWKGRWFSPVAGGTYDLRARQWSPELGVFLSVDEFEYHDVRGTLWSWPGQRPLFADPSGRLPWGPPMPPPVPPSPPGPRSCDPDNDRTPCEKECDDQHDSDHADCNKKKTPQERAICHGEANDKYGRCLSKC